MILKIDFDSEVPIYIQLKNQIIQGIARKEIQEGDELPSVRAMAQDIGVNMHTVNKSYGYLKDEGYIKIDRRKGAIIALNFEESDKKFRETFSEELESYMAECFNRGISKKEVLEMIDKAYNLYGGEL